MGGLHGDAYSAWTLFGDSRTTEATTVPDPPPQGQWRPRCRNWGSRRVFLINPEGEHHAPSLQHSWFRKLPWDFMVGKT